MFLLQLLILNNQIEKLPSTCELHHQIQVFLCLDNLVYLHNIWMVKLLQNFNLPTDPLNVFLVFDF